jgi:hypothetical protein
MRDLLVIVDQSRTLGAFLSILSMGLNTATPSGRLILNVLGSVAQHEREVMLEREKEAIVRAKSQGKHNGRAPTARRLADQVRALRLQNSSRHPIRPRSGRVRCAAGVLFDHLVGGQKQTGWHGPAEPLCRFEINARFIPGRGLHRKISRLVPT